MTLAEARQLLDAVRRGTMYPPAWRIRKALQLTGDIPGAWSSQELRRVPEVAPSGRAAA